MVQLPTEQEDLVPIDHSCRRIKVLAGKGSSRDRRRSEDSKSCLQKPDNLEFDLPLIRRRRIRAEANIMQPERRSALGDVREKKKWPRLEVLPLDNQTTYTDENHISVIESSRDRIDQ